MTFLLLVVIGLLVGLISSFLGVGGGIMMMPAFYILFPNVIPQNMIGCSLGVIFLNTLLNSRNYLKSGLSPTIKSAIFLACGAIVGAILGGYCTFLLSPYVLKKILGVMVAIAVLKNFFIKSVSHSDEKWDSIRGYKFRIRLCLVGLLAGFSAGVAGVGGGFIMITLFMWPIKMPVKLISMYSNIGMIFTSGSGLLFFALAPKISSKSAMSYFPYSNWAIGNVNFLIVLSIFAGAFMTSKLGVKLNHKVSLKTLKISYQILLSIVAIKILLF